MPVPAADEPAAPERPKGVKRAAARRWIRRLAFVITAVLATFFITIFTVDIGSITVAGNTLVGNRAYPGIAKDYRATFAKLAGMQADILLTSHPEMADVLDRATRREAGKADAFVDPAALPALVARFRKAFDDALAKARKAAK